jgi:hypothetical protein
VLLIICPPRPGIPEKLALPFPPPPPPPTNVTFTKLTPAGTVKEVPDVKVISLRVLPLAATGAGNTLIAIRIPQPLICESLLWLLMLNLQVSQQHLILA